jgi:penicillin G amidase
VKKININSLFPLLALIILISALSRQMFNVPPIGKVLDPFAGAVRNGDAGNTDANLTLQGLGGLGGAVQVYFDSRKVPHIFAASDSDLYFAQGYITASMRLWQMDFLSYAAAGRLSEIFRDGFLDYDRTQRRIGLLHAAEATWRTIRSDTETDRALTAYARGVNAYIASLSYKEMPLEYKLLDYRPEPWTPVKTVLIMKYLGNTLTGYEEDFGMTQLMLAMGQQVFNRLYPDSAGPVTPEVPDVQKRFNPSLLHTPRPDYLDYSFMSLGTAIAPEGYNPHLGSNSWAVSGARTASGYPILCSDPHLNLSLPSIWMEMQLSSPLENVYGVSIPGVPAIIIGFNGSMAWGITNGADDVKDYYKLKLTPDYRKYELDGKWIDLVPVVEAIGRRDQSTFYDTVYYTIHGPIVSTRDYPHRQELVNFALRWELLRPTDEFLPFIRLNRACNYTDFKNAVRLNSCPALNFTFAGKDDTIAVAHMGALPVKWPGQGKFLLDGTKSTHLYTEYIPPDQLPQVVDPSCHYVVSANQHPTSTHYGYYYNGYYSEERANRIGRLLRSDSTFDIKKMEAIQLDNTNSFAVDALPVLMKRLAGAVLDERQQAAVEKLRQWNGEYSLHDEHARLFELWWRNIRDYTWDELKLFPFYAPTPHDYVLLDMIEHDPADSFFDRQGTSAREDAAAIVRSAFIDALDAYDSQRKERSVQWGVVNKAYLMHPTNIPAFSRMGLPSAGCPDAIDAVSAGWGPSWRMIVQLGERPVVVGVFAGGESGDPASGHYDDFVDAWNKGRYFPLNFYLSADEAAKQTAARWTLKSIAP